MTEDEWLTSDDPDSLLFFLQDRVSERRGRLFAVACLQRIWHLMTDERSRRITEVVERHIEGQATTDEWRTASVAAEEAWADTSRLLHPRMYRAPERTLSPEERAAADVLHFTTSAAHNIGYAAFRANPGHEGRALAHTVAREAARAVNEDYPNSPERPVQAALLRDIFGNPFRPVTLDPSWLTSTVVLLARGTYEDRAFDRLPILADALQDAGCEHPDLLAHCRGPGPHVRGCWVVDLILGKD